MDARRTEILKQLVEIIDKATEGRVKVTELNENLSIADDLGLFSLDLLELAFELGVRYDISLKENDAAALVTVKDVVDLIISKSAKPTPAGAGASPASAPVPIMVNGSSGVTGVLPESAGLEAKAPVE